MKAALAILTLLTSFALTLGAAEPVSDDSIYDQVRIKIANDRTVGGGNIQVKVTNGVVELSGTIKQEKIKERAEKIAKKVKGVQRVENKLRVTPL